MGGTPPITATNITQAVTDINGLVALRGEEVDVDVRLHRCVNAVIARIERGEAVPSPAHFQAIVG